MLMYPVFTKCSWKELLAKAKKENKLIFPDAYIIWRRPCIMRAKNVFTHNEHFNVTIDMEAG